MMLDKRNLRKGDIVSIRPEFQDPGDDSLTWVVVFDEEKGRVDISPFDTGLTIPPVYTLRVEQVELLKQATERDVR